MFFTSYILAPILVKSYHLTDSSLERLKYFQVHNIPGFVYSTEQNNLFPQPFTFVRDFFLVPLSPVSLSPDTVEKG